MKTLTFKIFVIFFDFFMNYFMFCNYFHIDFCVDFLFLDSKILHYYYLILLIFSYFTVFSFDISQNLFFINLLHFFPGFLIFKFFDF